MRLLAFGGPWNEQVMDVRNDHGGVVLAALESKQTLIREDPETWDEAFRTTTYRVERVAYHDTTRCPPAPLSHDERCVWESRCLIVEGFPHHRITDALNAIVGMTRVLAS